MPFLVLGLATLKTCIPLSQHTLIPVTRPSLTTKLVVFAISPANSEACVVITAEDVNAVVLSLPRRKASGPDQVSVEYLINAPASVFQALASLFNGILKYHVVPSSFTCSTVIPIFKGGGKDNVSPANYRRISLKFPRLFQSSLKSCCSFPYKTNYYT